MQQIRDSRHWVCILHLAGHQGALIWLYYSYPLDCYRHTRGACQIKPYALDPRNSTMICEVPLSLHLDSALSVYPRHQAEEQEKEESALVEARSR